MSTLDDPHLFAAPPRPQYRPAFWMALVALSLLFLGLLMVALPGSVSGPIVWTISADHSLRLVDAMGAVLLMAGSALVWTISLIWQWQQTR